MSGAERKVQGWEAEGTQRQTTLRGEPLAPTVWRGYALKWEPWQAGKVALRFATVADLASHFDVDVLLCDPEAPEPPYWMHLWPGSRALARYLVEYPAIVTGRCLDVGCGLGLVALTLSCLGGQAFAFDRDRDAVALCQLNARHNGLRVHTWQADLREFAVRSRFSLVCAADVTYDPTLQRALLQVADAGLSEQGAVLVPESVRTVDRAWLAEATARGLWVRELELEESDCGRPVRVRLVELRRR